MRAHRASPDEAPEPIPDLEVHGGCFACGGDLSVRLRGDQTARVICRRCGILGDAVVERDGPGVLVAQLPVARA